MSNFCSICKLDDDDEDNFFYHRFSEYIYCIIYINIYIYIKDPVPFLASELLGPKSI